MKNIKRTLFSLGLMATLACSSCLSSSATAEPIQAEAQQELSQLPETVHELETFFVLSQERLALVHDLAKVKWSQNQNAEMNENELASTESDSVHVIALVEAQNKAAQATIQDDFALFEDQSIKSFASIKDYNEELLPQLQAINAQIAESADKLMGYTQDESLPEFLKEVSFASFEHEGVKRNVYDIAVEPLFGNADSI